MLDERGRQYAVHRGLAGMHALEVTARHDPQPRGLGGTRGDRVLDMLVVEAHRARGRGRRPDVTGCARDVPPGVVVRLPGGVCDPRLHLEPQREARQGIAPGDRPGVGDGQDRRPHRAASVHRRTRRVVDVVEVEHVRRERVEEGGERRRDPHSVPDHRRAATALAGRDGAAGAAGGVVGRAGDRHPEVVDQGAARRVDDRFGHLPALVLGDEPRQKRCRIASDH